MDDDPAERTPSYYLHPSVELRESPLAGMGLFATAAIRKGTIINIAEDNVVSLDEINSFTPAQNNFCYQIDARHYICPRDPENPTADWYTNHSCDPNTGPGGDQYTMVAIHDIAEGEEITYDYAMTETDAAWSMVCHCGSHNCRGVITGNDWKNKNLQERYAPYFIPDILSKIGFVL